VAVAVLTVNIGRCLQSDASRTQSSRSSSCEKFNVYQTGQKINTKSTTWHHV